MSGVKIDRLEVENVGPLADRSVVTIDVTRIGEEDVREWVDPFTRTDNPAERDHIAEQRYGRYDDEMFGQVQSQEDR